MNRRVLILAGSGLAIFLILVFILGRGKRSPSENKGIPQADALYNSALSWQEQDQLDKAGEIYQELARQFPEDKRIAGAWYELGKLYESRQLWPKAQDVYSKIIANFPNFKEIAAVEEKLWELNLKILFSPIVTEKDIVYKVEPGDTLGKIADRYNTTVGLIMRSNNLENDLIRPGKRLKISPVKYSIIVDKSQNSLALKADDAVFKVYAVATGRHNSTPTGDFTIVEKLKNPDWYKRGEGIIPADNPKNVLGTRWLGLSEPQYGIHGGASVEDLGTQITDGCIRMTNSDVEELFTILPRGITVTIVD